jgi:hypothetical protein
MRRGLVMRLVAPCFASLSLGLSALAGASASAQVRSPTTILRSTSCTTLRLMALYRSTLEEALAKGPVKISETGSVNGLTVPQSARGR